MRARAGAAAVAFAAAIAGGGMAASPEPELLRNANFEAEPIPGRGCPPSWGCSAHSDGRSYAFEVKAVDGRRGRVLKVTRVKPEPWVLVAQTLPHADYAGKRLRLAVAVNGASLEGAAGPMIMLYGAGGRVLDHRKTLIKRGEGWRRAAVEIDVAPGTERIECALTMQGAGSVAFDDVEAVLLPREGA